MKRTKMAKFRQLMPEIVPLLEQYTYEGVIDILKNEYDLEISIATFRNYLHRIKKESQKTDFSNAGLQLPKSSEKKATVVNSENEPTQEEVKKALAEYKKASITQSIFTKGKSNENSRLKL